MQFLVEIIGFRLARCGANLVPYLGYRRKTRGLAAAARALGKPIIDGIHQSVEGVACATRADRVGESVDFAKVGVRQSRDDRLDHCSDLSRARIHALERLA